MQNLEVEISSDEGGSYRVAARSDAAGDTQSTPTRFPFDAQILERRLQAVEFALVRSAATVRRLASADEQPVQEFGRQLFEFMFPAEVRENLNAVRRQAAQEDTHVQVRLRTHPAELAALPWEFLYDPGRDDYLCLSTPLVRYVDVLEARLPLAVTPPLRILGMVARPGELDTLNVDHEKRRLQQALAELERTGEVNLTWVAGQTWWDLQSALDQGGWHIFHFIGHGGFDQESGEGVLALADQDGGTYRLAASDLGLLLSDHRSLRLAVLNSCETARGSASDVFSSMAAVLMRRGIPAVVAMQYDISDQAAIAFAQGMYTAVAGRHPVDQAVTRARRAIKLARRNTLEWATPVLYLRSPRAELFDLSPVPVAEVPLAEPVVEALPRQGDELTKERSGSPRFDPAISPQATASPPTAARQPTGSQLAQMRHDGPVRAVAFSPDGTQLATASDDRTARLWEAATGRELAQMRHDDEVLAVAFSPDGTQLATASNRKEALLWELDSGREITRTTLEYMEPVRRAAFSPGGALVATGAWSHAQAWEMGTYRRVASVNHDTLINTLAFSPDGARLASGSDDKTVRVCDVATGKELAPLRCGGIVGAVAFSPEGAWLAISSRSGGPGQVRLWEMATGKRLAKKRYGDYALALAFSPDGTRLASGSWDQPVGLWEVATGKELAQMRHDGAVWGLAFSPDGARVATASDDKTARLWVA